MTRFDDADEATHDIILDNINQITPLPSISMVKTHWCPQCKKKKVSWDYGISSQGFVCSNCNATFKSEEIKPRRVQNGM